MNARRYIGTYLALILLLTATVWSHGFELGGWNVVINLAIAAAKAALIALVFMQLLREKALTRIFSLLGLSWLAILFVLVLADYLTR
ncbi:MAG TPA: cytochrome C oxidase subunit IV family protein [Gammaproteobacteria bacterium]|nr:cytochrome C oxidase subunit IV family protein [Gammaproteobacteria bacterium]